MHARTMEEKRGPRNSRKTFRGGEGEFYCGNGVSGREAEQEVGERRTSRLPDTEQRGEVRGEPTRRMRESDNRETRWNTMILSHCKDIESPCPSRKRVHYEEMQKFPVRAVTLC